MAISEKDAQLIAKAIAEDDFGALGDTSTLADPSVVDDLIENRMNRS
jgi:acetyl-CoA synthetase